MPDGAEPRRRHVFISPDTVQNGQPAADPPRSWDCGEQGVLAMKAAGLGYIIFKTYGPNGSGGLGLSILTDAEVEDGWIHG